MTFLLSSGIIQKSVGGDVLINMVNDINWPQTRRWLRLDEGAVPRPYRDSKGIWTVGYGHNMEANPIPLDILEMIMVNPVPEDGIYPRSLDVLEKCGGLNSDAATALLNIDIESVLSWLIPIFPGWDLWVPPRKSALVNMGFNLGPKRFQAFDTFIPLVQAAQWIGAADDLSNTEVAHELIPRYRRIGGTIRTGEWPLELS